MNARLAALACVLTLCGAATAEDPPLGQPAEERDAQAALPRSPDEIWATPLPNGLDAGLRARLSARAAFLAVVGDAARGDMEAVFTAARSLRDIEGEIGRSALDPLLEPHLDRGRNALNRFPDSLKVLWQDRPTFRIARQVLNESLNLE